MSTIEEIIAAQKAAEKTTAAEKAAAAAKTKSAQSSETKARTKKLTATEAEQALFLAASTAGSELLQALSQVRRGVITQVEANKKLKEFKSTITALRAINPDRADAVEKSVLPKGVALDVPKPSTATTPQALEASTSTAPVVPAPAPEPTPTPAPKPSGTTGGATGGTTSGTGKVVPTTFNVGTFRKADEASMAKASGVTPSPTGTKTPLDTLLAKTEFWYDLPDYIFKLDDKLGELLVEAVDKGWDNEKFLAKARLTPWWQKNADSVRTKIVNREKYNDLLKAGEDVKNTEYGMYLSKQMRAVKAKAKEIAGLTLTDEQAQSVAQKIYDGNLEDDPLAINALIVPFIGKTTSIVGNGIDGKQTGFGGQALQNYQTLQGIAKANGFSLRDILPNVSAITAGGDLETAVLRGLADGSIDINRVAQDARMLAAQGQPQYVRNLLGQGYDLEAVYAPYRKTMAATLELQPDEIDLNDPTLRMAITDKGDMNLYDFKKALRQDSRWQYTGQAKEEVSKAALKVLEDFGFQG